MNDPSRYKCWLLTHNFGVGSEVWMYRQASNLKQMELKVVCHGYFNRDQYPPCGFEIETIEKPKQRSLPRLLHHARRWYWQFRTRSLGGYGGHPEVAQALVKSLELDPPDVVLCHYGTFAVQVAPLLLQRGIPTVAHFNGHDLSSALSSPIYRRQLRSFAPRFAGCVVVADYMSEYLTNIGCKPERVHKIPYGAPASEAIAAEDVGRSPCRFIMVGRLTEKKRPDLSLRAFAMCQKAVPGVKLVVVGDGEMLADCQRLANELDLGDSVEWLGSQPFDRVQEELARSGAFIQHSVTSARGDKEGWPVAIAEASGAGLPVVSTRHASIPEQIEDDVSGLLCDEGDWEAMGKHMIRLAQNPELRIAMGRRGVEIMRAYDTVTQVAKLEQVLLELASKRTPS